MKKLGIIVLAVMLVGFTFSGASAALIELFDWAFNVDGTTVDSLTLSGGAGYYTPAAGDLAGLGGSFNFAGFDFSDGGVPGDGGGLGTITVTVGTAGAHFVGGFFDHEITEPGNFFSNEFGAVVGTAATTPGVQSWEIDEPGFVFGDIFDNFLASALDNSNGVPAGLEDDVSMALGWDFALAAGETATIDFLLAETAPAGGFYLSHTDPASNEVIYFSSTLGIEGGPAVPEPATLLLLGTGLLGLAVYGRKRFNNN